MYTKYEVNQQCNFLTYLGTSGARGGHALFRCVCGQVKTINRRSVFMGAVKSCGCKKQEMRLKSLVTHGLTRTPEYQAWKSMLQRCRNPRDRTYHRYGGRGITVCERWYSFENFLADMGYRPSVGYSLDRIDNDGNYSPENCRWATVEQQNYNKRTTRYLTFRGETLCVAEWGKRTGINTRTLQKRLRLWPDDLERVLTEPVRRS